jgi:hypothetical protein
MPAPRRTQTVQDEFDDTEEQFLRAAEDGRIDTAERRALLERFAFVRGELAAIDGAIGMCETILRTCDITPKVDRRLREMARDRRNVVAFRRRTDEPRDAA